MKIKPASSLTAADSLIRFGHVLAVRKITRRIHPLTHGETVSVEHERGTVDYMPNAQVNYLPAVVADGQAAADWQPDCPVTAANMLPASFLAARQPLTPLKP